MEYTRAEAKDYAFEHWHGCCNVILPSFTSDLSGLNEQAIRHDVRRNIEQGFWGALIVSECGTTKDEMRQFMEIAVDEAAGRQQFLVHGTHDTPDEIVEMCKAGEAIGMGGLLLGHPNSFYPETRDQLYDYLAYVCDRTDLAVCLFAAGHWNYGRLHPSGYPPDVLARACDLENVVAVKYEVARPGIAGDYEFWKMIRDKPVLFSDPLEAHAPLTVEMFGQQWMGTSNYEYFGERIPKYFNMLREGRYEEAMEVYWSLQPVRATRFAVQGTFAGANFIHRYLWKYQAWLHGYAGGPMRQPIMKLTDPQMRQVREGLVRAGFEPEDAPFSEFYRGRYPT